MGYRYGFSNYILFFWEKKTHHMEHFGAMNVKGLTKNFHFDWSKWVQMDLAFFLLFFKKSKG